MLDIFRLQLAALHFNENSSYEHDGKQQCDINFPNFKKGGYAIRKVTVEPIYG